MLVFLQPAHQVRDSAAGCGSGLVAGQHQGHQGLVDQHRVGLVDKRHVRPVLNCVRPVGDELVAQHIEADFVDRRVHNVCFVCFSTLICGH